MNILLFSGGLDSTSIAYWKRPDKLLFVDYGQVPAKGELRASRKISEELNLPLDCVEVDASGIGTGDLAGKSSISGRESEYWPFRNQFLITIAAMKYSELDVFNIIIGTVASDKCHPDGTPDFQRKLDALLSIQGDVRLVAPALGLTSDELIRASGVPVNLLGWTFSCHRTEYPCGQCRGCTKHYEQKSLPPFTLPPSAARQ